VVWVFVLISDVLFGQQNKANKLRRFTLGINYLPQEGIEPRTTSPYSRKLYQLGNEVTFLNEFTHWPFTFIFGLVYFFQNKTDNFYNVNVVFV